MHMLRIIAFLTDRQYGRLSKEYHRLKASDNQSEKPLGQEVDIQARLGVNKT